MSFTLTGILVYGAHIQLGDDDDLPDTCPPDMCITQGGFDSDSTWILSIRASLYESVDGTCVRVSPGALGACPDWDDRIRAHAKANGLTLAGDPGWLLTASYL